MDTSHVFVSHSSSDDELVRRLNQALEPHGVVLWIDRRELAAGDVLDPAIRRAIDQAAHVIVVLSTTAMKSAWVKKEVDYAREVAAGRDGFRLVPVLRPPFEPSMTSWLLGDDVVAIPLGEEAGDFDRAVVRILETLGHQLPMAAREVEVPAERPLADLILELTDPSIQEQDGPRRARSRVRLVYDPPDGGPRVTSGGYDFTAPLGPIEIEDLAWYLQRYSAWPSPIFQERAHRIEAELPVWGRSLYDALIDDKSRSVLDGWRRSDVPVAVSPSWSTRTLPTARSRKQPISSSPCRGSWSTMGTAICSRERTASVFAVSCRNGSKSRRWSLRRRCGCSSWLRVPKTTRPSTSTTG